MKETIKQIIVLIIAMALCWLATVLYARSQGNVYAHEIPEITEPCGLSTEELQAVLKHDLVDYAETFLKAEEDYGVNACFLASIAAHESGWGRYCIAENNIFGFGKKDFESIEDCIDHVASYLQENYLDENGKYYNGATIEGVAVCYCDEAWAESIEDIYFSFYEVGNDEKQAKNNVVQHEKSVLSERKQRLPVVRSKGRYSLR